MEINSRVFGNQQHNNEQGNSVTINSHIMKQYPKFKVQLKKEDSVLQIVMCGH
ncbi:putative conjugative transfer TraG domain protein [Orientia tsutsugamushi str. UT76]|nr:putative conjugative transfer TraG domain protein [Orientia tsutsugamushi str. UT76]